MLHMLSSCAQLMPFLGAFFCHFSGVCLFFFFFSSPLPLQFLTHTPALCSCSEPMRVPNSLLKLTVQASEQEVAKRGFPS